MGRGGLCVCWLVFPVQPHTCLLVCFINGNHLSKCFSKILHQDFMGKNNIFFMTHLNFSVEQHGGIYISPSGNVSGASLFSFHSSSNVERRPRTFKVRKSANAHAQKDKFLVCQPQAKSLFSIHKRGHLICLAELKPRVQLRHSGPL